MQQCFTLVKVRTNPPGREYLRRFRSHDLAVELDQTVNPWLLHWAQWYDPWSMSDMLTRDGLMVEREDYLYELVDLPTKKEYLQKRLRKKYQFHETEWLHRHLLQAIRAYEGTCPARIFLHQRYGSGSLDDEELFGSKHLLKLGRLIIPAGYRRRRG